MLKTDNTMGNCKRLIIQWATAKEVSSYRNVLLLFTIWGQCSSYIHDRNKSMVANIRFNQTIKSLHEAINVLLETK
jgi:hypothetical protein